MYLLLLFLGAFGIVAMTLMGVGHGMGGHSVSHAPVGHAGHSLGAGHHGGHVSAAAHAKPLSFKGFRGPKTKGGAKEGFSALNLLSLISPLTVFSVMAGMGAAGVLLKNALKGSDLAMAAFVGGLVFCFGMVRPLTDLLLRFASKPSEGLEGEVSSIGEAITRFDPSGQGLIRVILDEQLVQVLAHLDPTERDKGVQVQKGDKVVIVSVDAAKNSCVVSREFAPTAS